MRLLHTAIAALSATAFLGLVIASNVPAPSTADQAPLEIHEWGTFTSLQDEQGHSIGGINTDDEPVPAFVHEAYPQLLATSTELPPILSVGGKGVCPDALPDVTMRLETPILYFHLPPGIKQQRIDLSVSFHGGWLTQFYPDAIAQAPGLIPGKVIPKLDASTIGTLQWRNLSLGITGQGPKTEDPVWTAPRHVTASPLSAQPVSPANNAAEHEQFLFYRGVGHRDAPLRITRQSDTLELRSQPAAASPEPLHIPSAWLVDIRDDGSLAFRTLEPFDLSTDETAIIARTPATFDENQYSPGHLSLLRAALKDALQKEGMNDDEAEALLATWQHSYFKSPGLRLLFIVPRAWTDQVLPLSISGATTTIHRAMVGRIDLITPHQRALLRQIAAGPFGGTAWIASAASGLSAHDESFNDLLRSGRLPISKLTVQVPPDYAAYIALGRFRRALLLDEQSRRPTPALQQFLQTYQITAYHPPQQ